MRRGVMVAVAGAALVAGGVGAGLFWQDRAEQQAYDERWRATWVNLEALEDLNGSEWVCSRIGEQPDAAFQVIDDPVGSKEREAFDSYLYFTCS